MEKNAGQYKNNGENLRLAKAGDGAAMEDLIKDNYSLVVSVANRFTGRGCEKEDLIQIGMIGMLKAIRSFDESRGNAFSTYAVPMIMGEIRKFLRDDGLIKVSRIQKQQGYKIMKAKERFEMETGREARISDLMELTGLSSEEVASALEAMSPVTSLSSIVGDSDDMTLENTLWVSSEGLDREIEKIALKDALSRLEPLWQRIVLFRYFKCLSQQETASRLGITQVKVSREEKKIFSYLRQKLG